MKIAAIYLMLLIGQDPTPAQPLKIPEFIKGDPGKSIEVKAETTGKIVRWESLDADLLVIPPDSTDTKVWLVSCKPGKYRLIAWTAVDGAPTPLSKCWVEIGEPTPPPPKPDDTLLRKFQALYTADPSPLLIKEQQKSAISGLYLAMASFTNDKAIVSVEQLFEIYSKTKTSMILGDALMEMRKSLAAYIGENIGSGTLTDEGRARISAMFATLSKTVSQLK